MLPSAAVTVTEAALSPSTRLRPPAMTTDASLSAAVATIVAVELFFARVTTWFSVTAEPFTVKTARFVLLLSDATYRSAT